mmetsp:Transcript_15093/g.29086  ORF Transcript_15093/g.29086 Transcript_15093/m.29086 type:complete len:407 (-) Transcript_15093:152-1372(-)|eukprot:CAMPEP_0114314614 /NCGR_PEP_ID=MMETSP0059-20121206/21926_1 /TAXON_ID=36894 /ORGANISM="Pyramimonas parkeae, Strain CCMP726" /LENGTH=406 /DNA_ID=CAMNT_0001439815 /DNA_START=23 /DNA_END=1243 /DNA_ORIENTATION=+
MNDMYKDFERVAKKQRMCSSRTTGGLNYMLEECRAARVLLAAATCSQNSLPPVSILSDLHNQLKKPDFTGQVNSLQKEFQLSLSKLGKIMDRLLEEEITKALRQTESQRFVLDEVIAQHLFREGQFQLGEVFVREAGVDTVYCYKELFQQMYSILQQIDQKNLNPAIDWTKELRKQALHFDSLGHFEFQLHRLHFVQLLQKVGHGKALQYSRTNLSQFAPSQMMEIQRLMGCILFANRLEHSPYADLLAPVHWEQMKKYFGYAYCTNLGQAQVSPLSTTMIAGTIALPRLLKLANVMMCQNFVQSNSHLGNNSLACDMTASEDRKSFSQLPVEIHLGKEFVFHSVFACPVSKDQATEDNPPMLMPCGHVLCKVSITKLAKGGNNRPFKCPYCPNEFVVQQCKQLHF